jgi:hypothetical protein
MGYPYEAVDPDPTWTRWRPFHFVLKVTHQSPPPPDYCLGFSEGYLVYSEQDSGGPIYQCKWRFIRAVIDAPNDKIHVYVRARSPRPWRSFFFYNLKSWFVPIPFKSGGHYGTGGVKVVGSSATGTGSYGGGAAPHVSREDIETFNPKFT